MPSPITLTFLGTADQIPSKDRNHTAILLTYEGENILFDCGEGTQRQFRKANLNPCKLTRICITHWHNDHVLGLPGLLSTLALSGYNKKLVIYGPKGTKRFIAEMLRVFNFRKAYEIVVEEVSGKFYAEKDFYLEAKEMKHGVPCNAYSFVKVGQRRIDKEKLQQKKIPAGAHLQKLKEGKTITINNKKYSAKELTYKEEDKKVTIILDTQVNANMAPIAKNADLFVCEASFADELRTQAKEHHHMTAVEAATIAKKAAAKKLILTHISQRYEKIPKKLQSEAAKIFKNTTVAKDLDVVEVP